MDEPTQRFIAVLERVGVPAGAVAYAVVTAVGMREAFDKLGIRVLTLAVLLAVTAWCVYVWVAKRPSPIMSSRLVARFERGPRFLALASAIIMLLPSWFVLRPLGPEIPYLIVKVQNNTDKPVQLTNYGDCFFSIPESPISDRQLESGRVRVLTVSPSTYFVPSHGFSILAIKFLNIKNLRALLDRQDVALEIVIRTNDGRELRQPGIPFALDELDQYVELTLN